MTLPSQIVLDFLSKLPDTVRDNLYFQVSMFFAPDEDATVSPDYKERVEKALSYEDSYWLLSRIITTCAALDYAFGRAPQGKEFARYIETRADEVGSTHLKTLALQVELRDAHFLRAAKQWKGLRATTLSVQSIRGYEATLLAASIQGKRGR